MSKNNFLKKFNISEKNLIDCGIEWHVLEQIREQHISQNSELLQVAKDVSERIQSAQKVHSVRYRVKDSDNLIEKIYRKKNEKKKNYEVNIKNYSSIITDLVGIRVLHLFKEDWKDIHQFIKETWKLAEKPKAYFRKGDSSDLLGMFKKMGCKVEEHPRGYRSVHYLIETSPTNCKYIVEIQVRTIFEEGWSEIDHTFAYPYDQNNSMIKPFLDLFNRLAGSADEMGSFVQNLASKTTELKNVHEENEKNYKQAIKDLETQLKAVTETHNLSKVEQAALTKELENLKRIKNNTLTFSSILMPQALNIPLTFSGDKLINSIGFSTVREMSGSPTKLSFEAISNSSENDKIFFGNRASEDPSEPNFDKIKTDLKKS